MNSNLKIKRMVGMAILIAVVVVLQIVATFVKFGSFPITLTLVPIIVGAAMYGAGAGAFLGGTFGFVVLIFCINGVDLGGNVLWALNPALTSLLCIGKGAAAGFAAGIIYSLIGKKNSYAGAMCAAFASPIVNTGIFLAGLSLLFRETFIAWAGEDSLFYFAFIGLAGVNFLIELAINIVLAPAIVRVIGILKKKKA